MPSAAELCKGDVAAQWHQRRVRPGWRRVQPWFPAAAHVPDNAGTGALPYYDLALEELLVDAHVHIMYLDTGCSYYRHRQLLKPQPAAEPAHVRLPWWHAKGHGATCCLRNSGLYLPGMLCLRQGSCMRAHIDAETAGGLHTVWQ